MRKTDFGTINSAIASCLDDGEELSVLRVQNDIVYSVPLSSQYLRQVMEEKD